MHVEVLYRGQKFIGEESPFVESEWERISKFMENISALNYLKLPTADGTGEMFFPKGVLMESVIILKE